MNLFDDPKQVKPKIAPIVETTNPETAGRRYKKYWIKPRSSKMMFEEGRVWIFTDGSSTGWHAAVIVRPEIDVHALCAFTEPTRTRNIAAELNGFLLGIKAAPADTHLMVVHDYLGVGAWTTGGWEIKDTEVKTKIAEAKQLCQGFKSVGFIHHPGHQKDRSDFTRWNCYADELCSAKTAQNYKRPWSPGDK